MDLTKIAPFLKKAAAYVGCVAGVLAAAYQASQGDIPGALTGLAAALAAVGINLPVHVQVNAASK